jgi:hypothetical protein
MTRHWLTLTILLSAITANGCAICDRCDDDRDRFGDRYDRRDDSRDRDFDRSRDRDRDRDDLPPRPRPNDRVDDRVDDRRDRDRDFFDTREGPYGFRWIGPSKEAPIINPSIQNLQLQGDPIPPRAEDPSWRNR